MDFERIRFLKRLDKLEEEVSVLQSRIKVLEIPPLLDMVVKPPPKRRGRPPKVKDGH